MIPMTTEEMERLAYIRGDTKTADMLGKLIDEGTSIKERLAACDETMDEIASMIDGLEALSDQISDLADEHDRQIVALQAMIKAYRGRS